MVRPEFHVCYQDRASKTAVGTEEPGGDGLSTDDQVGKWRNGEKVPKVREVGLMSSKQTEKVKNIAEIVADHMTTAVMSLSIFQSD